MKHKALTPSNWKDADPTSTQFARDSPLVGVVPLTEADWTHRLLSVDLKEHVPEAIRDLFVIARGVTLYGWLYYPLFRVGEEHVYRVVEAAAKSCYRQLGGPRRRPTFEKTIGWLIEVDVIPAMDRTRWEAVRQLRNAASHPDQPSYMSPGAVLTTFEACAHDINRLFARARQRS